MSFICPFLALSSMVQSYVQTLNTPGSVPSINGAWEQYIGREGHTTYQIANAVYFNEMKERLEGRLPCDAKQIREHHTILLEDVMINVFEATVEGKGMSAEQLTKYAEEFQVTLCAYKGYHTGEDPGFSSGGCKARHKGCSLQK